MELFKNIIGFDWDEGNTDKNWAKHKVLSKECEEIFFNDPLVITSDKKHSIVEKRYLCFGRTNTNRLLTIIFTIRKNKIRIISARSQNRKEKKYYENETKKNTEI